MLRVVLCTLALGVSAAGADLPLYFEPNRGQAHPRVEFLSRGNGVMSMLTASQAVFRVGDSAVRMELLGASEPKGEPAGRLAGNSSYFVGSSASRWQTHVPQYSRVRYRNVYPGVDLEYYGREGKIEYDFILAPGADPGRVQIAYHGAKLRIDPAGDLVLATEGGEIKQRRPVAYQRKQGRRVEVAARYELGPDGRVGLRMARFDRTEALVVDPVLEYSTFISGTQASWSNAIDVDSAGNVYIAGQVPTPVSNADPFKSAAAPIGRHGLLLKFSPTQNRIVYAVGFGGPDTEADGVAVDASGSAVVVGRTGGGFPVLNAYQGSSSAANGTGFIARFGADGQSMIYSTYLGGSTGDQMNAVAIDAAGNAYIAGRTQSSNFPTVSAYQATNRAAGTSGSDNAVLAKFSPAGVPVFITLFGGSGGEMGSDVAVDAAGNIFLAGHSTSRDFPARNALRSQQLGHSSVFAAKFSGDGRTLLFATLLGGGITYGGRLALDPQGNPWVGGSIETEDLTVRNPYQARLLGPAGNTRNAFLSKLSADGSQLLYSSYFGTRITDLYDLAVDAAGSVYAAGMTSSASFPLSGSLVPYIPKSVPADTIAYPWVAKFPADGQSLAYSTLLGGTQVDQLSAVKVDPTGGVWVTGYTFSPDFPTKGAYQSTMTGAASIFLAKIGDGGTTTAPVVTVAPNGLTFQATAGSTTPSSQNVSVGTSGAATTFIATVASSSGGNWLSVSPNNGTVPGQLTVTANPAGLAAGSYYATVQVTPAAGSPVQVGVMLNVSPSSSSSISVSPSSLSFSSSGAMAQNLWISPAGGASLLVSVSASTTSGGNWLLVSTPTLLAPGQVLVAANTTGMAAGSYNGTVRLSASGAAPVDVPVTLAVASPVALAANPGAVSLQAARGGETASQNVTITNSGGNAAPFSASVVSGANWLSVSPIQANTPAQLTLSANPKMLAAGTYTGAVRIIPATGNAIEIGVSFVVTAPPAVASPSSLTFTGAAGGAQPQSQTVNVSAAGSSVAFTAAVSSGGWLSVTPNAGNTPASLTVSVNTGGMNAGAYTGSITLASNGNTVAIPVTLRLQVAQATLASMTPSSLAAGSAATTITLKGSGFVRGAVANSSGGQDLDTTFVDAGTLEARLTSAMLATPRSMSITVTNPGVTASNPLTLTITDVTPRLQENGVVNAASMACGSISPGEVLTLLGTSLGPATAAVADASAPLAGELGGARVLFDGIAAQLLYASSSRVSVIAPSNLQAGAATTLVVEFGGRRSAATSLSVAAAAPGVYTLDRSGIGQGAILNQDQTVNSASQPAAPGSVIALFATGTGAIEAATVRVTIGGLDARVLYAGPAPGLVSGIAQVNAAIPEGAPTGNATPVVLRVGDASSQPNVTVAVR